MSAAVERHAEQAGVGEAASADPVGGLDHRHLAVGGDHATGGRDAGGPGPDHHDVDVAGGRHGGERGTGRHCGGAGEKRAAV